MLRNRSGQFVYFSLVSAISGNPVTGASGAISGRKSLDGLSGMIVLSGNIIELGGGSYRANLFDFDTNGDQGGYLFSASGCVPVQYQFDMIDGNASGRIYLASGQATALLSGQSVLVYSGQLSGQPISLVSGQNVLVYSGQLSGQPISLLSGYSYIASGINTTAADSVNAASISGVFTTLPKATISGVFASVPISTLSGVIANSGLFVTLPKETISGVVANSGLNVTATATVASGDVYLASGHFLFGSGQFFLGSGSITSGMIASGIVFPTSGAFVNVPKATISGVVANSGLFVTATATVDPASISGAFVTLPKETISGVVANSGLFVTATATVASGDVYLASGHAVYLYSGQFSLVYSGQLSGQQVNINPATISGVFATVPISTLSGVIANSGLFVTLPKATISGVIANSGLNVTADPATISGVFATVPKATLSGVIANSGLNVTATATIASGDVYLASGHPATLYSGQEVLIASGQLVNLFSGNQVGVWSGTQVNLFSGTNVRVYSGQISKFTFASGVIAQEIPDATLTRDFTGLAGNVASGQSGRSLLNAARKLTNKWDMTATSGYLSVYQEDDTTVAMQQAVTGTSGATPVTSLDTR